MTAELLKFYMKTRLHLQNNVNIAYVSITNTVHAE
jgi:hypothetical protein